MDKLIKPLEKISTVISIPGSKSIANRALIAAALANGVSVIKNFPTAEDCKIMIEALRSFGVKVTQNDDTLNIFGNSYSLKAPDHEIFTGNAGTVMRFLASFATLADGITILTGDRRMLERPIFDLTNALSNLGADVETTNGYPPVKIKGRKFKGGTTGIDSSLSSQFLSSILLSSPYAENPVSIFINKDISSRTYIDLTIDVMNAFGVKVDFEKSFFFVDNKLKYKPTEYIIEGDYSSAAYFILAAMILNGEIRLINLKANSKQADSKFLQIAKRMNCKIEEIENGIWVNAKDTKIEALKIDANEFPDLVPVLSILALFADGESKIYNVEHIRYKETDRLKAISNELRKLGAKVIELSDGIVIEPSNSYHGAEVETYNDHRIAMSFAIAGLRIKGIKIKNSECVKKSFPEFWVKFEKLYVN